MDLSDGGGGGDPSSPSCRLLLAGTVPTGGEALFRAILTVASSVEYPITLVHGAHPSVVPLIGPEWSGRGRACILYSSERWPAPSGPHGPGSRVPTDGGADPTNDLIWLRRRLVAGVEKMLIFGGHIPEHGRQSGVDAELEAALLADSQGILQAVVCGWFGGAAATMRPRWQRTPRRPPYLTERDAAIIAAPAMTDEGFAALRHWLSTP